MLAGWVGLHSLLLAVVRALDAALDSDWLHGDEGEGSARSVGAAFLLCWWGRKERLVWREELMA